MYRLVTSLKVEKTGSDETALGILFMAQPNNKGGYMFEINKFKEYRIRRMQGAAFKNITGDAKNSGWVKHPTIVDLNLPNLVEIRTANSNFDLFITNTFVQTYDPQGDCADLYSDVKTSNALAIAGAVLTPLLLGGGAALLAIVLKRRAARHALSPPLAPGFVGLQLRARF